MVITNREAEKKMCPSLSTVDKDNVLHLYTCIHDKCVYWYTIVPDGSDKNSNGLGRCQGIFACRTCSMSPVS